MSDRIFELVHSLNKSEKRYFKQYLKRHSDNIDNTIYAQFFDYITRTNEYNKISLLKKCSFLSAAQLQNIRFRLYNLILESLRGFYAGKSVRITVYQMIISADILLEKGLFIQTIKKLEKAEKLASRYELDGLLEEILKQQEHVVTTRMKNKTHHKKIQSIQQKLRDSVFSHKKINVLLDIRAQGYNLFRAEGRTLRDSRDGDNFVSLLKTFETNFTVNPDSFRETYNYCIEWSTAVRFQGFFKEALEFLEKLNLFYLANEHYQIAYFKEYVRFLSHKVILLNMLKRFEDSLIAIKEIEQLYSKSQSKEIHVQIFENVVFHEIEIYLYRSEFEKAVELAENNLDKTIELQADIHSVNKQSKLYRIALSYFGNNDLKKALRWINEIINFDELKYRKDILSSVLVVNLLIHFELENYALLENRLQTTISQLKHIDRWLRPEKLLIQAIRDIVSNEKSELDTLTRLKSDFAQCVSDNKLDNYFIAYLDFDQWLNTKIKRLSI